MSVYLNAVYDTCVSGCSVEKERSRRGATSMTVFFSVAVLTLASVVPLTGARFVHITVDHSTPALAPAVRK